MKQPDHNKHFTAADIQRYHAGELSMQERHALEKAALDDPFLADALEGYMNTSTPQADLLELQHRLTEKTATRKRGVLKPFFQKPWVRVAALALLLAGAGWAVYQTNFIQKEELAITNDSNTNTAAVVTDSTAEVLETKGNKPVEQKAAEIPSSDASMATTSSTKSSTHRKDKPVSGEVTTIVSSPAAVANEMKDAPPQGAEIRMHREKETAIANPAKIHKALNTFRGQIVDPNGNPVPYANIAINGKQNGTTTNTLGQFFLTTPDSVVNATVAAVGFQSNRINLTNPGLEQKVILNQASDNLEEVVVTAYGTKRARSNTRPSTATTKAAIEEIEPEGGWPGFNDYITQNLQIPEEVTQKQLKGEVQLSFEVDKNGEPVNIKVAKSLCTSCDEEAIRLLKEGPGWKKKRKKDGKVTIRF